MNLYQLFGKCLAAPYRKDGGSANYATERAGERLYIFFEDSDGAEDWSINIDFPAKAYERMGKFAWFAHRGFLDAWKRTEKYLARTVSDESVKSVTVAGYSHGAAMALLCHEYIWFNRPDLRPTLEGYGFGCPRVIWGFVSDGVARRWENFLVIRNIDDIVTHLPPSALGYSHVGRLLEIGESGKYTRIEAHYAENILNELRRYEKNK
ncbi:MAG: hypothetical protein IKL59_03100 [Clostridia bacterium]|nr:hypothetical protein [Clostridia bacterium]